MKVIHLQNGLLALKENMETAISEENPQELPPDTKEEEMREEKEDKAPTIEEPGNEAPTKLTEEELKKKMKSSLEFLIEQQALGQMENSSESETSQQ